MLTTAREFNQAYLSLHIPKEDLYWATYMDTSGKDAKALEKAEVALKNFISSPENLKQARAALQSASPEDRVALEGWVHFFESNSIENPEAQKLQAKMIELESAIFQKRSKFDYSYEDSSGKKHLGSMNLVGTNITTSPDEVIRKTSHDALLRLEQFVLTNGYLDQVKLRNEFARALGYPNYFAYKLKMNEGLTIEELDRIFRPFEEATREKCFGENARISREKGLNSLKPHNLLFSVMGDVTAELDPYFAFSKSMIRWGLSFWRLGIRFRGASLTLDLLDREGKYDNGFMHGPMPCYFEGDRWIPARINFTSTANPSQVGSGRRGIDTLFHEGGHAAHFANILQPAPCFSQEFPPTSMAYAETQSMFCDSLLDDADWMKRYARNRKGEAVPDGLLQKQIQLSQPLRAYRERSILVVSLFERRLYEMKDSELTPTAVTQLARRCEKEVFNLECIARPLLSVPHLLGEASACSYQGYLLAHMAVYQTRNHFMKKYGSLVDRPEIGKELAESYWKPGNRITHTESVKRLTGEPLSGEALAATCNLTNEAAWEKGKKLIALTESRGEVGDLDSVDLDAKIRVIHGDTVIAENTKSFGQLARDFEAWIDQHYPAKT